MADLQCVPSGSHANVEEPDYGVPLRSAPLICGIASRAEIRKQKDDVCLSALDGVNRSDNHPRGFLQRCCATSERDASRELHAAMKCWRDAPGPPLDQLPRIAASPQQSLNRVRLEQFTQPLGRDRQRIVGCFD